jgi:hypothetical protein
MIDKIKKLINDWSKKRLKRKLIREMIIRYNANIEMNKILEEWITQRILSGQTERRQELLQKQAEISETTEFIKFISKIK